MAAGAKKLEEILVDAGIASTRDLERARRRMTTRGGRLCDHLATLDGFDDERFAQALSAALGVPLVDESRLHGAAAPKTPARRSALRALALERVLLPIGVSRSPRAVEVAVFDPTDTDAIARLRKICDGAHIKIVLAPRKALLGAIAQTYGREQAGELQAGTPRAEPEEDGATPAGVEVAPEAPEADDEFPSEVTRRVFEPRNGGAALASVVVHDAGLAAAAAAARQAKLAERGAEAADEDDGDGDDQTPTITRSAEYMAEALREIHRRGDTDGDRTPGPIRDPHLLYLRVLEESVALLASIVERRVGTGRETARTLARLGRRVGEELGLEAMRLDELMLAAHLFSADRALRASAPDGEDSSDLLGALGWAAADRDAIGAILRALAGISGGPGPSAPRAEIGPGAPVGARIIAAVADYLALAEETPGSPPDRAVVNQLLRVTTSPEIIEALGRVLDAERTKESNHAG